MSKNISESKQGKEIKTLTPKQMLQKLPIALAQIIHYQMLIVHQLEYI